MNDAALSENFTAIIAHRNVLFFLSFYGSPSPSARQLSAYLTVDYLSPAVSGHMMGEKSENCPGLARCAIRTPALRTCSRYLASIVYSLGEISCNSFFNLSLS